MIICVASRRKGSTTTCKSSVRLPTPSHRQLAIALFSQRSLPPKKSSHDPSFFFVFHETIQRFTTPSSCRVTNLLHQPFSSTVSRQKNLTIHHNSTIKDEDPLVNNTCHPADRHDLGGKLHQHGFRLGTNMRTELYPRRRNVSGMREHGF